MKPNNFVQIEQRIYSLELKQIESESMRSRLLDSIQLIESRAQAIDSRFRMRDNRERKDQQDIAFQAAINTLIAKVDVQKFLASPKEALIEIISTSPGEIAAIAPRGIAKLSNSLQED